MPNQTVFCFISSHLPNAIEHITLAIDTQDDRLECELRGWSDDASWGLGHFCIPGTPDQPNTIAAVRAAGATVFTREDGRTLGLALTAWDPTGHYTDEVYAAVADLPRTVAMRGILRDSTAQDATPMIQLRTIARRGIEQSVVCFHSTLAKDVMISSQQQGTPYRLRWTGPGYDGDFMRQYHAEERVSGADGRPYYRHHTPGVFSDAFDLLVMGYVAIKVVEGSCLG